jgi:hypothetical protein
LNATGVVDLVWTTSKHKLYMAHNLQEEAPPPSYNIFYEFPWGYIQMAFVLDSQNWDFYCFKTLNNHSFVKTSLLGAGKDNIL